MNNKKTIAYLLIVLATLVVNIINSSSNGIDAVIVITSTIIDLTLLFSYILLASKPIMVTSLIFLRQLCIIAQDMYMGSTFTDALAYNSGLTIIVLIMLIVYTNIIDTKSTNVKDRIKELLMVNRKPYKVAWYIHLIVYSVMIISINVIANNENLNILSNDTSVKIFGALALALPVFEILAIVSTSTIAYVVIIVYELVKIYTLISLYTIDSVNFTLIAYSILQLAVIVYSIVIYKRDKSKEKLKCQAD